MSARQQQSGTMSPEQMAAAQERLAVLQEQSRVFEQERTGLHTSLIDLNEKAIANNAEQSSILVALRAAGIALLGDVSAAAQSGGLTGIALLGDVSAAAQSGGLIRFPLVIGQPVTDQGIPFSQLTAGGKTINLNLIPDFLRDASGKVVRLNGNEAVAAITALNGGGIHGNGFDAANNRAVAKGEFKDGTIILARGSDLLQIACERETNPALKQMNEIIASGSLNESWGVSGTETSDNSSYVCHVRLKGGRYGWDPKVSLRSLVVALRGFNCG